MAYAAPSSGTLLSTSSIVATTNITSNTTGNFIRVSPRIRRRWSSKLTGIYASVSAPVVSSKPDDLVSSIISKVWLLWRLICSYMRLGYSRISLSGNESPNILNLQVMESGIEQISSIFAKVLETDRGVSLTRDEHKVVAELAEALKEFCVDEPVKCPLIFGGWDVVYCSVPTSPGGGYRSALGRIVFKTKEIIQVVEAPDIVQNKVAFSALGFLDGEVSLNGKLKALDEKWIQVVFEPPELKVGAFEFKYGSESEVKLQITYIDEKIRLGKGSRGSLFVFQRRQPIS